VGEWERRVAFGYKNTKKRMKEKRIVIPMRMGRQTKKKRY